MSIAAIYLGWAVATWAMFWRCRPAVAVLGSFLGGWILLPVGSYPAGSADAVFPYWIIGLALPSDMLLTKAVAAPAAAFLGVLLFDRQALARLRPVVGSTRRSPCGACGRRSRRRSRPSRVPRRCSPIGYLAAAWGLPWLLGRLYFASRRRPAPARQGHWCCRRSACLPFSLVEGALGPVVYDAVYETHPFRADGAVRYVGFRPLGFFEHGNQFGLWISLGALAALWLAISSGAARWRWVGGDPAGDGAGRAIGRRASRCWRSAPAGLWAFMPGAAAAAGVGRGCADRDRRRRLPLGRDSRSRRSPRTPPWGREIVNSIRGAGRGSFTWRIAPGPEAPGRCRRAAGDRQRAMGLVASEGNATVGPVVAHRRPVRARRPLARLGDAARPGAANRLGRAARKRLATGGIAAAARVDRGADRDRRAAQLLRLLSGDRRRRRPRRRARRARRARRRGRRASAARRSSPA